MNDARHGFKRRAIVIGALLILAGALLFCLFRAGSRDITRFIMSSGSLDVNETLSLDEADEDTHVLFFTRGEGTAYCAVIEERLFSYEISEISGQLPLASEKPYTLIISVYDADGEKRQLTWGVLNRSDASEVTVNGREARLSPTQYGFSFFYFMEPYSGDITDEYTVVAN